MYGGEPAPRIHELAQDLPPVARRLGQPPRQRRPAHELHRDEHAAVVRPDLVDRHDVRVGDARHRLGLADEARGALGAAVVLDQLERDLAIERAVVAAIDDAHAAGPERAEHLEPADRGRSSAWDGRDRGRAVDRRRLGARDRLDGRRIRRRDASRLAHPPSIDRHPMIRRGCGTSVPRSTVAAGRTPGATPISTP